MTWFPRSKGEKAAIVDNRVHDEYAAVVLACGHATDDAPLVSSPRPLFTCPEGCGLQRRAR